MFWCNGGFTLRVISPGSHPGHAREMIVDVNVPHAVIGRAPGGTITIDHAAVSSRHVYLHLDRRGLFAVDLATRTGTRIGPHSDSSGWLHRGDRIELADRVIEVLDLHLDEPFAPPDEPRGNPLDNSNALPLTRLTLHPEEEPREPLSLNSELVFAGRSSSCGVVVNAATAMRVQCVLIRSTRGAFLVDLVGRGTWRNDNPVRGAAELRNGDSLLIGANHFQCRVESFVPEHTLSLARLPETTSVQPFETYPTELLPADLNPPLHLIPSEAQAAVLGWLMGQIQTRQEESYRRQSEFQTELVRLVSEIQRDNHSILSRHLERTDSIHRELLELREEFRRRFVAPTAAPAIEPPRPEPLRIAPVPPPADPAAAADWLLNRVSQLDQDNRKGWKDLLGRLSGRRED